MNHSFRLKLFLVALLPLLSGPALALSTTFTYQGSLADAGQPANGGYDFEFTLQTQTGTPLGAPVLREDVAVVQGVFTVDLDFGSAITSGDFQLQIGVRPGASVGSFTALSPPTRITPTPQAQVAGVTISVSPDSITSASIADGSIVAADIDSSQIQRRVSTGCSSPEAIGTINADGSVSCVVGPQGPKGDPGPTSLASCPSGMIQIELPLSTLCFDVGPALDWDSADQYCFDAHRASLCTLGQYRMAVCRAGADASGRAWTTTPTSPGNFATVAGCTAEMVSEGLYQSQFKAACCAEWPRF